MPRIRQNYDRYALKDLGRHIGGRIKDSGKTQGELAKELRVSQQTVSRWVNTGNMTIEQLQKISKVIPLDFHVVLKAALPWEKGI
jgi:transcriptional regulator with XRE-family HTH domain